MHYMLKYLLKYFLQYFEIIDDVLTFTMFKFIKQTFSGKFLAYQPERLGLYCLEHNAKRAF